MFDHLDDFVQRTDDGSDGVSDGACFTEERSISSLIEEKEKEEAKEEKEETGDGGQANEVETPDLARSMEGEGEGVVTSAEVESGGSPGKKTIRRRRLSKKQSLVLKGIFKSN